jgi:hypothetical protein
MRFVVDAVATVTVAAVVGVAMVVMEPCHAFAFAPYYPSSSSTRLAPPPSTMTSSTTTTTTTWSSALRMAEGSGNNGDEELVMNKYSR